MSIRLLLGSVLAILMLSLTTPGAAELALKCTQKTNGGLESKIDIRVDLDRNSMTVGVRKYVIQHITSRFITALDMELGDMANNELVGGEIFVLDRITGDFQRASVGMFCDVPDDSVDPNTYCKTRMHFGATTYSGRCVRPLL